MPQGWWCKLCGLFEHCLKSVWISQHACTAVQTVYKHFSWTHYFVCCMFYTHFHVFEPCLNSLLCSGVLFKQFGLVWQCLNTVRSVQTSCAALHAVRTLSEHCSDMLYIRFHVSEWCSNSPPCGGVLFKHCSNSLVLFGKVQTLRTVFKLCTHAHHLR